MDHDDAMVGRLISRREALAAAARAGLVLASAAPLAAISSGAQGDTRTVHLVATPHLTEGPFFVDEKLNRSDLTTGTNRPSVVNGLPLLLALTIYRQERSGPVQLKDAHVDVWHADVNGVYSDEANPMNHENTAHQNWLRGYQVTDAIGRVQFKTIFPGWYPGRSPHIHFKVRSYSAAEKVTAEFTSQLFFKDADARRIYAAEPYGSRGGHETTNAYDGVYNEFQVDGRPAGQSMLLDLEKRLSGYQAHFSVLLTAP
ncbi:MAG TPA: hypothetical protein VKT78_17900 [Fimbriimonadaceae bacterium]|nr:hypothetical protein [Fimbriimonadaceae bacterium]